jgi:hypothetical protein
MSVNKQSRNRGNSAKRTGASPAVSKGVASTERRNPSAGWGIVRSTAVATAVTPSFTCWDDADIAATDWNTELAARDAKRPPLATAPAEEFACVVR